jgi:glycosyltransferase involved in cell wall biosynthesis
MNLFNSRNTFFYKLLDQPLVFVVSSGLLFKSGVTLAIQAAKGQNCYVIVQPSWDLFKVAKDLASDIFRFKSKNKYMHFVVLCPTFEEVELLNAHGVEALWVHKNAFIDEKIFHPIPDINKKYSAIHIANVEKFKRHHLAWNIQHIAVLTYSYKFNLNLNELRGYKHLAYSNFNLLSNVFTFLNPLEVNRIICASNCGLILSAKEGTNNASTEYLLSGIPVVSTQSDGGRKEFFNPHHVSIVNADPDSVQMAVNWYQRNYINPTEIRESILVKIRENRRRFLDWLCKITKKDFYLIADKNFWIPQFINKLRISTPSPFSLTDEIYSLRSRSFAWFKSIID